MRKWITAAAALVLCCSVLLASSLPAFALDLYDLYDSSDIIKWMSPDVVALNWSKDTDGLYNCASSLASLSKLFVLYWTTSSSSDPDILHDVESVGYICQSYRNSGVYTPDTLAANTSCWFLPFENEFMISADGYDSVASYYVLDDVLYNPYMVKFFTSSFPSGVPVTVTFSVLRTDESCKYYTNRVQAIKFNRSDDGSGWEYVGYESIHGTYTPEEIYGQGNFTIAATFDDVASWDCDAVYFQLLLDGINGGTWHIGLDSVGFTYEPSSTDLMQEQFDETIEQLNKVNSNLNKVYNKLYYMDWSMTDIKNMMDEAIYGESGVDSNITSWDDFGDSFYDGMADVNDAIGAGADLVSGMVSSAPMVTTLTSIGGLMDVFFEGNELTLCGVTFNPFSSAVIVFGGFSLIMLVIVYIFRKRGDG